MGALVLLALCLVASIGPWVWIGLRSGNRASAWGLEALKPDQPPGLQSDVSQAFGEHLRGRLMWVMVVLVGAALILHDYAVQAPEHFLVVLGSYVLCWLTSTLVLGFAWLRVGRQHGVPLGLLAIFFLSGGVLGVAYTGVLELLEEVAWQDVSQRCNLMVIPMTPSCNMLAAAMWILTPGLIEETGKGIWLFFRLRRSQEQLPGTCCFGLFRAEHSYDCGCWYKLAPTPYHVVLSALAAGAGFECLENIKYVFVDTNALAGVDRIDAASAGDLLGIAEARSMTSGLHMVWTGLIGWGLARRLFLPEGQRPSLPVVVLPSVVLHGLYDYALAAMPWVKASERAGIITQEDADEYASVFLFLLAATSIGSCCIMARLTGLRICSSSPSCCCAPDFWAQRFEARVPPPRVGYAVRAREAQVPLIS